MSISWKQSLKQPVQQFGDWVTDRGTRLFAWAFRSAVEDASEFTFSNGDSTEVYWYSSRSEILGQATIFKTILLNRTYFKRLTPTAKELIVRHELGHANRRPSLRGILLGMAMACAIGIYMVGWGSILAASGQSMTSIIGLVSYGAVLIGLFIVTNRVEETTADLEALRVLGEDAFIDGYQEISDVTDEVNHGDSSPFSKAWMRLCYTHPENVVRLNRLLERVGV